tara:strand:+ start:1225 stop:2664 length:1440 start_codon:yes stop_codon:yes gene_type:complete
MIISKKINLHHLLSSIIFIDSYISKDNKYLIWLSDNKYNVNWLSLEFININDCTNNNTNNTINSLNISNNNEIIKYKKYSKIINDYTCYYLPNIQVTYYCINIQLALDEPISCYEYNNEYLYVLTSESENIVYEFDLKINKLSNKYTINTHYNVIKLYITNDRKTILAYCLDNTIQIFNIDDENNVNNVNSIEIPGWIYYFSPVAFFNDTKLALYCGSLCIYDLQNNVWIKKEQINYENKKEYHIKKINISFDEKYIFLTYFNKYIEQFETENFTMIGKYYIDNMLFNLKSSFKNNKINYKIQDINIFSIFSSYNSFIESLYVYPKKYKEISNLLNNYILIKNNNNIFIIDDNFDIIMKVNTIQSAKDKIELLDNNRLIKFVNHDSYLNINNYMYFPNEIKEFYKKYLNYHFNINVDINVDVDIDVDTKKENLKENLNEDNLNEDSIYLKNNKFNLLTKYLNSNLLEYLFKKIKIGHFL